MRCWFGQFTRNSNRKKASVNDGSTYQNANRCELGGFAGLANWLLRNSGEVMEFKEVARQANCIADNPIIQGSVVQDFNETMACIAEFAERMVKEYRADLDRYIARIHEYIAAENRNPYPDDYSREKWQNELTIMKHRASLSDGELLEFITPKYPAS